jgi:hypothetical protein
LEGGLLTGRDYYPARGPRAHGDIHSGQVGRYRGPLETGARKKTKTERGL